MSRFEIIMKNFARMDAGTYEHLVGGKITLIGHTYSVIIHPAWSKENINKCWKMEVYKNGEFNHEFRTPDKDVLEWYLESNVRYFI